MAWLQTPKGAIFLFPLKVIFCNHSLFSASLSRLHDLIRDFDSLGSCRSQKRKIKSKVSSSSERGLIESFVSTLLGIVCHNYLSFSIWRKKKSVWNIKIEEKNQHCVSFLQHASMLLKNINPHKKCGKNICTFWLKRWLEREKNITTDRILPERTPVSYWWNTAEICSRGGEDGFSGYQFI